MAIRMEKAELPYADYYEGRKICHVQTESVFKPEQV
jgi:hypothetical protein